MYFHITHNLQTGMTAQGMECGGVGWRLSKSLKTNYYKSLLSVILYKHVAYHQFTIACIQYVVMIHLSEQDRLIELES